MKKLLVGLLMASVGAISYGKIEYDKLSQLPKHSQIKITCENVDELWFANRRNNIRKACFALDGILKEVDNVTTDIIESRKPVNRIKNWYYKSSDDVLINASRQLKNLQERADWANLFILAGQSDEVCKQEEEILSDYVTKVTEKIKNQASWL